MRPLLLTWASALCLPLIGCTDLTAPPGFTLSAPEDHSLPSSPAAEAERRPEPAPVADQIQASHILVAYRGAKRAQATRTKEEARRLANQLAARLDKGEDFAKLAREHSDCPSKSKGGDLGSFGRHQMVRPFADAAFKLRPGETTGVVETDFGFHIIKRTG